jgi:hypothetical protein
MLEHQRDNMDTTSLLEGYGVYKRTTEADEAKKYEIACVDERGYKIPGEGYSMKQYDLVLAKKLRENAKFGRWNSNKMESFDPKGQAAFYWVLYTTVTWW